MLFHLKCELADLESCDPKIRDEVLRSLLRAHRLGDHVVVMSRDICKFLIERADLSRSERAMLERIGLEFTQKADLPRSATRYVHVSPNKPTAQIDKAIWVEFRELLQSRILDRSALLVENIRRDGLLYSELMKAHFDLHHCPPPAYETMHGGGDDTKTVFIEQIRNRRIVCGVVDTDRFSAMSQAFTKRDAMRRIARAMNWPFAFAFSPPCREAENCLPMTLVMSLKSGQSNSSNKDFLEIFEAELAMGHQCEASFWLFVDLKEGVSSKSIGKMTNEDDRRWIQDKLSLIGLSLDHQDLQGYGDKVFDQIESDGHYLSELRMHTRRNDWRAIFADFMEELLWIFAGGRKVVT
jgi:hypothetical protein